MRGQLAATHSNLMHMGSHLMHMGSPIPNPQAARDPKVKLAISYALSQVNFESEGGRFVCLGLRCKSAVLYVAWYTLCQPHTLNHTTRHTRSPPSCRCMSGG